jgi:hypothetical protein
MRTKNGIIDGNVDVEGSILFHSHCHFDSLSRITPYWLAWRQPNPSSGSEEARVILTADKFKMAK